MTQQYIRKTDYSFVVESINGFSGPVTIKPSETVHVTNHAGGHIQLDAVVPTIPDDVVERVVDRLIALEAKTSNIVVNEDGDLRLFSDSVSVNISGSTGVTISGSPTIESGYPTTILDGKTHLSGIIEITSGTFIKGDSTTEHPLGEVNVNCDLIVGGDVGCESVNKVTVEGVEEGLRFTWKSFVGLKRTVVLPWDPSE
jgi:hypothetical protein